jgi:uncharacterized NAD-dependent epimerase/dehydratase family protein
LSPKEARARGARALVIGVANVGGMIAESWMPSLMDALDSGLDIISGMHTKLNDTPQLKSAAERRGRRLIDVRTPPRQIPISTGRKRTGLRLLTVGTDCALGKKYTALALARAFTQRGLDADFRATGQTGIMISGRGIPMDAVVADFAAGAAELLTPDAPAQHWDVIEGQGSLFHPAYAGVSLALLHGSQPDVIVVCHQPGRERMLGTDYLIPDLGETIDLNLRLGRRTNAAIGCAGVSLDTSRLEAGAAHRLLAEQSARLGLPVADPMRGGAAFEELVDSCLAEAGKSV